MLQRAASNAYSWWWASHIRTKQSKWVDNNLHEMEERVKSMLKIIEEDADSFAKRAEMYYKRRPELINFVEEAYRAYRALAERYDHISGELHKANHTIATAFPDQIQFGMQDEEDESSPKAISPIDSAKIPKPPAEIPQISFRNKSIKKQSAIKKPQHRKVTSVEKDKAQEEIDRLQKRILVLQTEKEFIKSSYESGLAKYWEIEKQVAEMQEEVCHLQDEFSASAIIEDDEARALMAATALKSCEDTLVSLQEQQKRLSELARIESRRIKSAKEKMRALRGGYGHSQMETGEVHGENKEASTLDSSMEEEVYDLKQERLELESICQRVREHFEASSDMSVVELAEKIDELVNKVINLEITIASQTVQIDRLRSESDELQKHLQILEEDNLTLIDDSHVLSDKLRQAEEELQRIQDLEKCVQDEKKVLRSQFTEACDSLNDLSERLQSPKHQDVVKRVGALQDGDISPVKFDSVRECKEKEGIDSQDTEGTSVDERLYPIQEPGICLKEPDDHVLSATVSQLGGDLENSRQGSEKEITKIHNIQDDVVQEEGHGIQAPVSWLKDKGNHIQSGAEGKLENDSEISKDRRKEVIKVEVTQDYLDKEEVHMKQELHFGLQIQENNVQTFAGSQLENVLAQSKDSEKEVTTMQDKDEITDGKAHVMHKCGLSLKNEEKVHRAESKLELDSASFEDPKQDDKTGERDSLQADDSIHLSTQLRDQEGTLALQQLLLNGLEGREKILLTEYTSILRNYKEIKKRLSEAERKNQDYRFEVVEQIGELKSANAMKDEEIRLLRQKLSSLQAAPAENSLASPMEVEDPGHRKLENNSSFPRLMAVSSSSRRLFSRSLKGVNTDSGTRRNASFDIGETDSPLAEDGIKLVHIGEPPTTSVLEEKFRRDIDTLLEENLEFWLRFSTTFHDVQKFQTAFEDLQAEIEKLKDSKTQEGSSSGGLERAAKPETAPIDKQLRELKTELQVWLEQNAILKGELQIRFSSLCDIQEEISNVLKSSESEDQVKFTPYQAAKFQGEVLNMQQENNKVADELQAGLDHVRVLQSEVEKALSKLHESLELHGSRSSHHHHPFRHFSSKTRMPLRSFLFGSKPKKQSIFACMNPALQKQSSDLRAAGLPP